ncbi:hypothetical protein Tco_0940932 [Tanacetum coccineum]|uniref:Uncharacterized protein n=1 Tax=Tanacetum coccineum TaxID=301880 RepID=A0ABQ5DPN6_9ASTR
MMEEATTNSTQAANGSAYDGDSATFGEELDMRAATIGEDMNFDEIGFNQIQPDAHIDASLTSDPIAAKVDGSAANAPMDATEGLQISMCVESWGRISFSLALVEVCADSELKKEVGMAIPDEEGDASMLGANGHKKGSNKDNGNNYPKDDVNFINLKNSFAKLMKEDKVLDECIKEGDVGSSVNVDGKDKEENDCNKVVTEEVKDESDEDEVCMPDVMPSGGFLDGLDDYLDCYDGYEA